MMYAQTVFRFCECITFSILVVLFLRLFSKLAIFIVTRPWRRYRTFTFRSSQGRTAVNNHSYSLYCAVCLQEAEEGDKMRRLTICRHCFHADCIDPWLGEMSSTCPLCRAEVPPLPPVNPLLLLFVSAKPSEVASLVIDDHRPIDKWTNVVSIVFKDVQVNNRADADTLLLNIRFYSQAHINSCNQDSQS
ncbi:hypothetical protein YC2023_044305 [Brassica napus]